MSRRVEALYRSLLFFVCFAPIPVAAGYFLLGSISTALIITLCELPVAWALGFVPGYLREWTKKSEVPLAQVSQKSADPNPDRGLRSEAHPAKVRRLPLRAPICSFTALLMVPLLFFTGILPPVDWPFRLAFAVIIPLLLPLALRFMVDGGMFAEHTVVTGVVLYLVAGVAAWIVGDSGFHDALMKLSAIFLVLSAISLNRAALYIGTAAQEGGKPPRRMQSRNRLLLVVLGAVVLLVVFFDKLRAALSAAGRQLIAWAVQFMMWLGSLFSSGTPTGSSDVPGGDEGMMELGGEASPFWQSMDKVITIIAIAALTILLIFALRIIVKKAVSLYRKIRASLRRFADSMGTEYQDEQETIEWGDRSSSVGEGIRARLSGLFTRSPRWDALDGRQRVRQVVKVLYRKAEGAGQGLGDKTIHEAVPMLRIKEADPQTLAQLYDRARYAPQGPSPEEADRLRKDVGL